jgi:hypothetical protein
LNNAFLYCTIWKYKMQLANATKSYCCYSEPKALLVGKIR